MGHDPEDRRPQVHGLLTSVFSPREFEDRDQDDAGHHRDKGSASFQQQSYCENASADEELPFHVPNISSFPEHRHEQQHHHHREHDRRRRQRFVPGDIANAFPVQPPHLLQLSSREGQLPPGLRQVDGL